MVSLLIESVKDFVLNVVTLKIAQTYFNETEPRREMTKVTAKTWPPYAEQNIPSLDTTFVVGARSTLAGVPALVTYSPLD